MKYLQEKKWVLKSFFVFIPGCALANEDFHVRSLQRSQPQEPSPDTVNSYRQVTASSLQKYHPEKSIRKKPGRKYRTRKIGETRSRIFRLFRNGSNDVESDPKMRNRDRAVRHGAEIGRTRQQLHGLGLPQPRAHPFHRCRRRGPHAPSPLLLGVDVLRWISEEFRLQPVCQAVARKQERPAASGALHTLAGRHRDPARPKRCQRGCRRIRQWLRITLSGKTDLIGRRWSRVEVYDFILYLSKDNLHQSDYHKSNNNP